MVKRQKVEVENGRNPTLSRFPPDQVSEPRSPYELSPLSSIFL
jgi:hypothetical protein